MKTKRLLTRFGSTFFTLRFDERSFFNTFLDFKPYWDYKTTIANHVDSPGVYTSYKILSLSIVDKFHIKCDVIDGSILNGLRQHISCSFVLDKLRGYRLFCEPGTIHFILKLLKYYLVYI